jgi:Ca2+-binding EF-hand superfamily protein
MPDWWSDWFGVWQDGFVKLNKVFNMMLTEEQIEHLMRAIDVNGDGELSYNEFLNAFKIVDTAGARK